MDLKLVRTTLRPPVALGVACLGLSLISLQPAHSRPSGSSKAQPPSKSKGAPEPSTGHTYQPKPEVMWFTISNNGHRTGLGRSEYGKGEAVANQFQNLLLMNMKGYRVAERSWWEFGANLKPANFYQKTIIWRGGQSVTNTVDGVFDYATKKLNLDYREFGAQETLGVDLPVTQVSRNTQNLVLSHDKLAKGKVYHFKVYSIKERHFVNQDISVTDYDTRLKAWQLEARSEEAPGSVVRLWFQTASAAHPNGWTVKTSGPGPDNTTIELQSCSRAEAVQGFEKEAGSLGI
jgi:hypothetical protein